MSPQITAILMFVLASTSAGGLLVAAVYPRISTRQAFRKRMELALGSPTAPVGRAGIEAGQRRKRSVDDTLKEIAETQRAKSRKTSKPSLAGRLRQSGLAWSTTTYWMICAITAGISFPLFWLALRLGALPALGFGIAAGLFLPHMLVGFCRNRRFKQFSTEFPNAIDVIVRGVKSGLPLGDCIRIVANEGQNPVRAEFKTIIDDQTLGMPIDEAVHRMAGRVPMNETNFLAIVVTIQSRTGGNLSEALSNLSGVLRERKKMRAKIKSMSAEAKASGGIIGALPVLVAFFVYLTSPDYIALLFTTTTGNIVLAGCGLWMLTGILVMRKMIAFDF